MSKVKNRKNMIIGISIAAVLVVAAIVALLLFFNRSITGGSDVAYGKPHDYEADGFITLGEYKGINMSVAVTDEDVQEEIASILEDAENYEQLSGTAKTGDYVSIDMQCFFEDGTAVEDYTYSDEYITLGDEDYFAEFDTEIAGMNTGDTKEITVAVPKDYGDEIIDGKTLKCNVTLNYICGEAIEQEITDEFVTDYSDGECTSAASFNDYVRQELYNENVDNLSDDVWYKVTENVEVKKYHRGELKNAEEETVKSYESFAEMSGYTVDELLSSFGMTEDDVDEVAKESAVEKMVAKTIAAKENLTLDDETYKNMLLESLEYEDGEEQGKTLEDMENDYLSMYEMNPKDGMLEEYVMQYILSFATIEGMQ